MEEKHLLINIDFTKEGINSLKAIIRVIAVTIRIFLMHAVFCSRLQNFDNADSIDSHFCIKFGHFDANRKIQTVKMFVEQHTMIAENCVQR